MSTPENSARLAVCIAVDGWRASALGTYGNAAAVTPHVDAFAARASVYDAMWRQGTTLRDFYRDVWAEAHDARPVINGAWLITDDPHVAELGEAAGCGRVVLIETTPADGDADSAAETTAGQFFAAAAAELAAWRDRLSATDDSAPYGALAWIHARGFHGDWDAPRDFRRRQLEQDDPPAAEFIRPPQRVAEADDDQLLLYRTAYAAQAEALDECLGGLLASLEETARGVDLLTVLIGCRGFALGEHGLVGMEATQLYGELLHIPCLVRRPDAEEPPPRIRAVATPQVIGDLLAQWRQGRELPTLEPRDLPERRIVSRGPAGEASVRTALWFLRRGPTPPEGALGDDAAAPHVELFAKPDDRWEANDVADRCEAEAAALLTWLNEPPRPGGRSSC